MDWESDKRTDKERFFDGLYSIPSDDNDPLETSEATLLFAASREQRNITKRFIPRLSHASTVAPGAPTIPRITRASTMPLSKSTGLPSSAPAAPAPSSLPQPPVLTVPRSSPPPESSRMLSSSAAGKTVKRKRAVLAPSTKKLIFKDLYFYFVPNDLKNPARKLRVQKTDEHGGFCLNEWREKNITHVIVDARLRYGDVLKYLKQETIPQHIIVVNEDFISDCLDFGRIVNDDQSQYKVPGYEPSPQLISTSESVQSLRVKTAKPQRTAETLQSTQEPSSIPYSTPRRSSPVSLEESKSALTNTAMMPIPTPGQGVEPKAHRTTTTSPIITTSAPQLASEQKVLEKPKDELDAMIEEAQKMGDLLAHSKKTGQPSLDDGDESDPATQQDTSSGDGEPFSNAKKKKLMSRKSKSEKAGGWQGRFQCMQKNDGTVSEGNPNKRTIEVLEEMQKYYEMTKDQWRSMSYRKAINTLRKQEKKIVFASEARDLFNIGESLAEKIEEIVRTDHLRKLDYAKLEPADAALKLFLGVYGVGPSLAHQWVQTGHRTLEDLRTKAKLSQSQRIGVGHYDDFNCRIPREEVKQHGDIVMEVAASIDPALQLEIMGSYRRGAKDCGDIDIMVTKEGADAYQLSGVLDELVKKLFAAGFLQCGLAIPRGRDDGLKWHGASKINGIPRWRRIDFLVAPWDERGATLLYFTGSDIFNRSMRLLASKKGYGLNQRGLFKNVMRGPQRQKVTDGTKVEGEDEKRIFEILGVPYRTPEERIC